MDECQSEEYDCGVNAQCNNTFGSFNCTCLQGYVGDGMNCSGKAASIFALFVCFFFAFVLTCFVLTCFTVVRSLRSWRYCWVRQLRRLSCTCRSQQNVNQILLNDSKSS